MKEAEHAGNEDWQLLVRRHLPIYGHRNWIVVADAAYPAHASTGIETVGTGAGLVEVLAHVLAEVAVAQHVTPAVYVDRELEFVTEEDAPGVSVLRERLAATLRGYETTCL